MRVGMQVGVGEDSGSVGPAGLERVPGRPTRVARRPDAGIGDVAPPVPAVGLVHDVGPRGTPVGAVREPPATDGRRPATTQRNVRRVMLICGLRIAIAPVVCWLRVLRLRVTGCNNPRCGLESKEHSLFVNMIKRQFTQDARL